MNSYNQERAKTYHRYLGPLVMENAGKLFSSHVAHHSVDSILEIACGTGILTNLLSKIFPEARIVGLDISSEMLHLAKKNVPSPRVSFEIGDAASFDFKNSFDLVLCQFGYMFFEDHKRFFENAKKALRPGGKLVFSTWDSLNKNVLFNEVFKTASQFTQNYIYTAMSNPFEHNDPKKIVTEMHPYFQNVAFRPLSIQLKPMPFEDLIAGFIEGNILFEDIEKNNPNGFKLLKKICSQRIKKRFPCYWETEKGWAWQFESKKVDI